MIYWVGKRLQILSLSKCQVNRILLTTHSTVYLFLRLNFTYYWFIYFECICLFHIYMCIYMHIHVCLCMCVCLILCTWICVQIHVFIWGWCQLPAFIVLHLIFWSKVSFTSEISYPICVFHPIGYRWVTMPTWQLHVFWGIEFYHLHLF